MNKITLNKLKNITQSDLENLVKMAHKGIDAPIEYKRIDDSRDIEIKCTYSPHFVPKDDIYPYFELYMKEEELHTKYYFSPSELPLIVEAFNKFISQGAGESYLQNNMLPY